MMDYSRMDQSQHDQPTFQDNTTDLKDLTRTFGNLISEAGIIIDENFQWRSPKAPLVPTEMSNDASIVRYFEIFTELKNVKDQIVNLSKGEQVVSRAILGGIDITKVILRAEIQLIQSLNAPSGKGFRRVELDGSESIISSIKPGSYILDEENGIRLMSDGVHIASFEIINQPEN